MELTGTTSNSNLSMPLTHSRDGRENPKITGCKAAINAVFYCPSKSEAVLFRFMTAMTGCCRQLSSWPVPVFGILTLRQLVAHSVRRIATALYSNTGHKPMLNHTQNPLNISVSEIKQNSLKKQHEIIGHALDIFCTEFSESNKSALKHDALVAERVTFDQAKHYHEAQK